MDDYNRESSGKYLMPFKLRENLVRDGWQPDYRPSRSISNVGSVLLVHITHTKTAITVEWLQIPPGRQWDLNSVFKTWGCLAVGRKL
jgi:hypothetical protein